MPLYFLLGTLTPAGQKMLHDNPDLVIEAASAMDLEGSQVLGQYAVLGRYDFVMLLEADDNHAAARFSLELGVRAGLHTETLPAMPMGSLAEPGRGERQLEVMGAEPPSGEWRLPGGQP